MTSPHAQARKAITDALSNATYGWNAKYPAIAATYSAPVANFALNFTSTSGNVFFGQLAGFNDLDLTQLDQYQCVAIYTTSAVNQGLQRPRNFSGVVVARVDWMLSYRGKRGTATGIEANNTEAPADAIDECMHQIFSVHLGKEIALPTGVTWARQMACDRSELLLEDDGFSQMIRYELVFEVNI